MKGSRGGKYEPKNTTKASETGGSRNITNAQGGDDHVIYEFSNFTLGSQPVQGMNREDAIKNAIKLGYKETDMKRKIR